VNFNGLMVLVCSVFGVLAFLSPIVSSLSLRSAISISLDFWMAAGLIRLSGVPSWQSIATAATLIAIRKMTNVALSRRACPQHS
jgi:uncharacterized membrane protein